jgi:phage terminase large subunit-like protein
MRRARHEWQVELTAPQAAFVQDDGRVIGLVGGRGAGKTTAGAVRVLVWASRHQGTYLVLAPTYTMLRDVAWPRLMELGRDAGLIREVRLSRLAVELATGSHILARSADVPQRLRGLNLSGAWLDEASLMPSEVQETVALALRERGNAWLACTFTPQGRSHWTYRLFGPGGSGHTIRAPSRTNPWLPRGWVDQQHALLQGPLAAQELEGQWVDLSGVDWPAECWGDWVLVPPEALPPRAEYQIVSVAVDPSLGKKDRAGDYSAIIALGVARDLLWVQADLARRSPQQLVTDTLHACERFKPDLLGIEANQFQELLIHEFERVSGGRFGLSWPVFGIINKVPKLVRIRRLGQYITRRELRIAADPSGLLLLRQLQEFPLGEHDDGPDALEMAVRLILEALGGTYGDDGPDGAGGIPRPR